MGILRILFCVVLTFTAMHAGAQSAWPTRPVKIVVPFAAGGATDVTARAIATHLSKTFGQSFVVENKSGASGKIGTDYVLKAEDDHVLLMNNPSGLTLPWLIERHPSFDPVQDFQPVIQAASATLFLAVNSQVPVANLQEFLAYAKTHPGKLSYASIGSGSAQHFVTELLKQRVGISLVHIPYRGEAPAINDLLSGTVEVYFIASGKRLESESRVRLLGVAAKERWFNMPQVPTFAEQGLKDFTFDAWNGLFAPKGLPADVVKKLNAAVNEALAADDVKEAIQKLGFSPVGGTSSALAQRVALDIQTYRPLIEQKIVQLND